MKGWMKCLLKRKKTQPRRKAKVTFSERLRIANSIKTKLPIKIATTIAILNETIFTNVKIILSAIFIRLVVKVFNVFFIIHLATQFSICY